MVPLAQATTPGDPKWFPSAHESLTDIGHDGPLRSVRLLTATFAALATFAVTAVGGSVDGPGTAAGAAEPAGTAAAPGPAAAAIATPGKTSRITRIASTTSDGWRFDQYRNPAYPCAVQGDNTFTIATRLGVPDDEVHPLWVFMHGGGVGYFAPNGKAMPNNAQKIEENAALQQRNTLSGGLKAKVAAAPAGFRMMAVSMCDHDIYGGGDTPDPNNPNKDANGDQRTVNGLFATKAAIQYALTTRATDDYFLHGGSAGSFGSWHVGWSLEAQGIPPAGIIGDSGVLNQAWQLAVQDTGCGRTDEALTIVAQRLHPEVGSEANQPHHLVADGKLTAPLLQVWDIGDPGQCGTDPVACPLPDGSTPTMGSVDCLHEPLRAAIAAAGDGRSANMRLCVDNPSLAGTCDRHVPSNDAPTAENTIAPWPADFQKAMLDWVTARLGDDGAAPPADRTATASFATAARTDFLSATPTLRRVEADVAALDAGLPRSTYLTRLSTSDEWLAAVVDRLYKDTLGRPGDPGGTAFWVGQLRSGTRTVAQAAASFYASAEYYRGFGGGTDRTWVSDLYPKLLGRPADPGGLDYWTGQTATAGRDSVARRFYQSPESARARVTTLYGDLLGRAPDPAGLTYWSTRVVTTGDLFLAVALAGSNEYRTRAAGRFP